MKNRFAKRVDKNALEIVRGLSDFGYAVVDMSRVGQSFPDLLVANSRACVLIEIKDPEGQFYIDQLSFLALWPHHAGFAVNVGQAYDLLLDPETKCLTEEEKEKILIICAKYRAKSKDRRPRITVARFEKEMILCEKQR